MPAFCIDVLCDAWADLLRPFNIDGEDGEMIGIFISTIVIDFLIGLIIDVIIKKVKRPRV